MLQAEEVGWESLTREVREAFCWAHACEPGPDVGTRALLIGIVRARPGANLVETLLSEHGLEPADLFTALRDIARPRIEPWVSAPSPLTALPVLTPNGRTVLDRAITFARRQGLEAIDTTALLAGLLDGPGTARRVLERMTGGDLAATADALLAKPPAMLGAGSVTAILFEERNGRLAEIGLGLFLPDGQRIVTATDHAAATHTRVDGLSRPVALSGPRPTRRPAMIVFELARIVPPPPRIPIAPLDGVGQSCVLRSLRGGDVTYQAGAVDNIEGGGMFAIATGDGTGPLSAALGSPVINMDGALLGIVLDSGVSTVLALDVDTAASVLGPPSASTGNLSGAGNDLVGDDDRLGFRTYVEAFADLITSPNTQPPLTVGVFGSWGMGKSFLLEHIARAIKRRDATSVPQVHVVRFNAWEYSATEVVWPGLVRKIVKELDELATWPLHKRLATRVRWNLRRRLRELGTQLMIVVLIVAAGIVTALVQGAGSIAAAIASVAAVAGVGGLVKAAREPVARSVVTLFAGTDYGQQQREMEDIRHDLLMLERRLHDGGDNEAAVTGRILVLIDDLDRCEPGKAVEVLQAVNLLLNFPSFVVCLGIDARIVTGAIEKHYEGLLGRAGASGYEYLDKIVQIPFRIPEPGPEALMELVAGQMGNPDAPAPVLGIDERPAASRQDPPTDDRFASDVPTVSTTTELDPPDFWTELPPDEPTAFTHAEVEAFRMFAAQLRPNPRHLKRVVNVYRLVRSLAHAQREQLILDRPGATVRWLLMWSQWPYTSMLMMEEYDAQLAAWGRVIPEKEREGDPIAALLERVEARDLDHKLRARLDDDPERLRALLGVQGCALTWDEIRRIRRYTVNFNPAVEEQGTSTS